MLLMETKNDLKNEQVVAARLMQHTNLELIKLSQLYRVDYCAVDAGRVVGFYEIKCRTFPSYKYSSTLISLNKVCYMKWLSDCTALPINLVVSFTDCIMIAKVDYSMKFSITLKDNMPIALLNLNQFERLF